MVLVSFSSFEFLWFFSFFHPPCPTRSHIICDIFVYFSSFSCHSQTIVVNLVILMSFLCRSHCSHSHILLALSRCLVLVSLLSFPCSSHLRPLSRPFRSSSCKSLHFCVVLIAFVLFSTFLFLSSFKFF